MNITVTRSRQLHLKCLTYLTMKSVSNLVCKHVSFCFTKNLLLVFYDIQQITSIHAALQQVNAVALLRVALSMMSL
jgi:hypothetical protein